MSFLHFSRSSSTSLVNDGSRIDNEIEALNGIYMDNFSRLGPDSANEIKIKLTPDPFSNISKDPFCWVELKVKYSRGYPRVVPDIEIANKYNVTEEELDFLNEKIGDIAFDRSDQNMEMIHDICEAIQKFLDDKNRTYDPQKRASQQPIKVVRKRSSAQEIVKINENFNDLKKFLKNDDPFLLNTNMISFNFDDSIYKQNSNHSGGSRFTTDFEIIEKLGQGGGGSVYKVRNKFDGMFYAIKRVNKH